MTLEQGLKPRICVFAGGEDNIPLRHRVLTRQLGSGLAKAGFDLVYGGGPRGLMQEIATSMKEEGAEITAIIPSYLKDKEWEEQALSYVDKTIVTETLHERKKLLEDHATAFLVLPGGLGTLDELFEVLSLKTQGQHSKKVVLANFDRYWQSLRDFMTHVINFGYARPESFDGSIMYETPQDILNDLSSVELSHLVPAGNS